MEDGPAQDAGPAEKARTEVSDESEAHKVPEGSALEIQQLALEMGSDESLLGKTTPFRSPDWDTPIGKAAQDSLQNGFTRASRSDVLRFLLGGKFSQPAVAGRCTQDPGGGKARLRPDAFAGERDAVAGGVLDEVHGLIGHAQKFAA